MRAHKQSTIVQMVDYGGSNLRSVQKAFEMVGVEVEATADPEDVRRANRLVLPGVGAFGASIEALRTRGLDVAIIEAVDRGASLLGICLGMQLLFEESEELGSHKGLGLIPGCIVKFRDQLRDEQGHRLKVPHVGWNEIVHSGQSRLLAGVQSGSHAYFVHSYYCAPKNREMVLASTDYGGPFTSVIGQGAIYGLQFHPEKSQSVGLRILHNFATLEI